MIKLCVFLAVFLAAAPVLADIEAPCADLWFSRNAMLDQAGYCFATPLGKATFDNSDCATKQPNLSLKVSRQIALITKLEQGDAGGFYEACKIDTTKRHLDLAAISQRKQLDFQPATDGSTSVCLDYLGADIPLYAAPWKTARHIGKIKAGDNVSFGHQDWNGWSFSLIGRDQDWVTAGWYKAEFHGDDCKAFAG